MEILFDETFPIDGTLVSRNIWYGYADILRDGEYGKTVVLDEGLMETLCGLIRKDLTDNSPYIQTETNWYFYGAAVTQDAIGDDIRQTIMVRERDGEYTTNFNISDHDFVLKIDEILVFKAEFENRLAR